MFTHFETFGLDVDYIYKEGHHLSLDECPPMKKSYVLA